MSLNVGLRITQPNLPVLLNVCTRYQGLEFIVGWAERSEAQHRDFLLVITLFLKR